MRRKLERLADWFRADAIQVERAGGLFAPMSADVARLIAHALDKITGRR